MKMITVILIIMIALESVMGMLSFRPIGTTLMVMVWVEKPAIISVLRVYQEDG